MKFLQAIALYASRKHAKRQLRSVKNVEVLSESKGSSPVKYAAVILAILASPALIEKGVCRAKTAQWIFTKLAPGLGHVISRSHAKRHCRMLNDAGVRSNHPATQLFEKS